MRIFKDFRIKNKIIIIILIIAALSSILGNVINYIYEVNNSKKQLIANTILQAKLISESCWLPLEFNYPKDAETILKQLHTITNILDGVLYTQNDSVFASYHKSKDQVHQIPKTLKTTNYIIEGNYLHVKQTVQNKDEIYGSIYLRSQIDWRYIIDRRLKVSILIIVLMLIIVWILANIMQNSISQPIVLLTDKMKLLAKTKDYSVQLNNTDNDEIGELYRGFNYMLSEINVGELNLKNAFESLKQSEIKWQFAIEGAGDGLWDWNVETNNVNITARWKEMLGYSENEIANDDINWEKLVHPDDYKKSLRELEKHFKGQTTVYQNEYRLLCKDGTYKWILARGKVIEWTEKNKPRRFIGTHSDITKRKLAEEELLLHQNQLEQLVEIRTAELKKATLEAETANKAKSSFLANMSHEIRTPMNAILGYSSILINDKMLNNRQLENLEAINRSGYHLLGIINDILDISKIEAGKIEIQNKTFNLHSLLNHLRNNFAIKARDNFIDFSITIENNIPEFIRSDPKKVRQVFANLLSNAFKYTDQGMIQVQVELGNENKNCLITTVTDTGIGIAADSLHKIFEPFDRGIEDVAREGTGLGLAIIRNYARLMNGDITVTSTLGQGSKFTFTLPFEIGNEEDISKEEIGKKIINIKQGQFPIRVLIVDDKDTNQDILMQMLEPYGFELKVAENGAVAVEYYQTWDPHIVLMDIVMPVMDGKEAAKMIKGIKRDVKPMIIFISAVIVEQSEKMELLELADAYLIKPIDKQNLFEIIATHPLIRFEYEKQKLPEPKKEYNFRKLIDDIKFIEPAIRRKINHAAIIGSRKDLIAQIQLIKENNMELAEYIEDMLRKMKFNKIAELFNEHGKND